MKFRDFALTYILQKIRLGHTHPHVILNHRRSMMVVFFCRWARVQDVSSVFEYRIEVMKPGTIYIYIYIYTQWLYFQSSGPRRDKILVLRGPQIVKFQHLEHADNFTNLLQNSLVTLQRTTEIYCETIRCKWSTCINKSRTWKINSEDMDLAITETQKKNRERYERIENNLMEIRTRRVRQKKEKMISYRHGSYLHLFSSHLSLSFITLDFVKL